MINYDENAGGEKGGGDGGVGGGQGVFSSGGVTVRTRTVQSSSGGGSRRQEIRSTLTVRNAVPEHSGNYSCVPSNAEPASIQVFVSEGETGTN